MSEEQHLYSSVVRGDITNPFPIWQTEWIMPPHIYKDLLVTCQEQAGEKKYTLRLSVLQSEDQEEYAGPLI